MGLGWGNLGIKLFCFGLEDFLNLAFFVVEGFQTLQLFLHQKEGFSLKKAQGNLGTERKAGNFYLLLCFFLVFLNPLDFVLDLEIVNVNVGRRRVEVC